MKPYYEEDGITIYHGDCREVLLTLGPLDAIITDPVWPNAVADIPGKEDPYGLLDAALASVVECKRVVLQFGCDSDPRILAAVPDRWPFIRACWMDMARPHYKGLILAGAELAYVFGELPKRDGWTVLPGMCRSHSSEKRHPGHPCPRKLEHMQWLVRYYGQGMVCDPFTGSGTTLEAAKEIGVPAIGIEIEEKYCEIAAKRLAQGVLDFA
jgi:DNA modification methylase